MNKLVRKFACVIIAFTLFAGIFAGCSNSDTEWFLDNEYSLLKQYGSLPPTGTVGDIEYRVLDKGDYTCYETKAGYYTDMLEQLDSPYFIVVTPGSTTAENCTIDIVDLGMDGSTLWILVKEKDGTSGPVTSPHSPCCVLEVDHLPDEIKVVGKNGRMFSEITG